MPKKKLTSDLKTGALARVEMEDGARRIKLTKKERETLAFSELVESACALFLDLESERTWPQIAIELNISLHQLKELVKTPEFVEKYNLAFAEIGHDPRYKAVKGELASLASLAVTELKNMLTSARTPAGVKFRAIEKILQLNSINNVQPNTSDRRELVEFLQGKNVNLTQINVTIPPEYMEAVADAVPLVIDGDANFVESLDDAVPQVAD